MNHKHGQSRQKHRSTGSRRALRASFVAATGVAFAIAITVAACSLVGNIKHDDCTSDAQCISLFGAGSKCSAGYCSSVQKEGCEGVTSAGVPCFSCPPERGLEFENACTDAECAPFDNKARLTKLTADGKLPALP
jgi:hypothetical protein